MRLYGCVVKPEIWYFHASCSSFLGVLFLCALSKIWDFSAKLVAVAQYFGECMCSWVNKTNNFVRWPCCGESIFIVQLEHGDLLYLLASPLWLFPHYSFLLKWATHFIFTFIERVYHSVSIESALIEYIFWSLKHIVLSASFNIVAVHNIKWEKLHNTAAERFISAVRMGNYVAVAHFSFNSWSWNSYM